MTQKKILRIILIAAVALFILPVVLAIFQPMHGSAAWERTNDGSFDRLYGADPFSFALSFTSYKNNISSGGNSHENARRRRDLQLITFNVKVSYDSDDFSRT